MRKVDRCERGLPSPPSPWRPDTDEGDHGAVRASALAGYQVNGCVGDNYPPVLAQCGDLENLTVQSTALHRVIEPPPVQGPENGRDDHVETAPECVVGRMTHDVRHRITPLMNDALAVDGHCGAAVMARLRSVHTVITTRTVAGFTDALIHCAVN
jgi:hypothetical protein